VPRHFISLSFRQLLKRRAKGEHYQKQGTLTEWEGSVRLTSLLSLVWTGSFLYWKYYLPFSTKEPLLMKRSSILSLHTYHKVHLA
jgi:hypothetical protein